MGILSHWPLILLLVIVLIILGPGKLPQIGGAIGGAIREFRKSTSEIKDDVKRAVEPAAAAEPSRGDVPPQKDTPEAPKA